MIHKFSKGGVSMAVFIISIFSIFGFEVPEEMVENAVMGVVAILSLAGWIYGQIDRSDLKFGLFRK